MRPASTPTIAIVLSALFALFALLALPACRPRPGPPAPAATPGPAADPLPGTDPRPLTPVRREGLEEFGRDLAARLSAGEFDAVARELDIPAMTDAAFAGIQWDEHPHWAEFRDSLVRRLRTNPAELFSGLKDGRAVFLRLRETPSGTAALIRCLIPTGAATYFDVFARFDEATGTPSLANIYNHATGLDVPDSLRSILFALAPAADRSLADRLFGAGAAASPEIMDAFDAALRQRNPAAVAAVWPKLPDSLRAQRPVLMAAIQVLMLEPQAPGYLAALEEARARYGDEPLADLFSIDIHFLNNDTAALEACLDRIAQHLGGTDAHLENLRASGRLAANDIAGAESAVDDALALEPDFTNASATRLRLLIARRDFPGAVALLESVEDHTGRILTPPPASRGQDFADFLESPGFRRWKSTHPDPEPPAPAPPNSPAPRRR